MGFNYKACGYDSANEMFIDFSKGELQKIEGMMSLIKKTNDLINPLQNADYDSFGSRWNNSSGYGSEISDNIEIYMNAN